MNCNFLELYKKIFIRAMSCIELFKVNINIEVKKYIYTVGSKIIQALEIIRAKKLKPNAVS